MHVVGGFGEKKSNGGTQWYQQDRVYGGGSYWYYLDDENFHKPSME